LLLASVQTIGVDVAAIDAQRIERGAGRDGQALVARVETDGLEFRLEKIVPPDASGGGG
jgi:hypothetical protein